MNPVKTIICSCIFIFSNSMFAYDLNMPLKLCEIELPLNFYSVLYLAHFLEPRDIQNFALAFPVYSQTLKESYFKSESQNRFGVINNKATKKSIDFALKRKTPEQGFQEVLFKKLSRKFAGENEKFIKKNKRLKGKRGNNVARTYVVGGNFYLVNLEKLSLGDADLTGSNFSGAKLNESFFLNCNLRGANFASAQLMGAVFRKCNLQNVNFAGAFILHLKIQNCETNGANFLGGFIWDPDRQIWTEINLGNLKELSEAVFSNF